MDFFKVNRFAIYKQNGTDNFSHCEPGLWPTSVRPTWGHLIAAKRTIWQEMDGDGRLGSGKMMISVWFETQRPVLMFFSCHPLFLYNHTYTLTIPIFNINWMQVKYNSFYKEGWKHNMSHATIKPTKCLTQHFNVFHQIYVYLYILHICTCHSLCSCIYIYETYITEPELASYHPSSGFPTDLAIWIHWSVQKLLEDSMNSYQVSYKQRQ